jgi:stage V sporulation protein G
MTTKPAVSIDKLNVLEGDGPTKAFCNLMILDTFVVRGLRVLQGKDGLFVSMPRDQQKDGKWFDVFFPVSKETRKGLQQLVLDAYAEKVK